jgi:hypothetical protein
MTIRIGELAARAEISTKAIRYYEQIGILTHSVVKAQDPSATLNATPEKRPCSPGPRPTRPPHTSTTR